MAGNFGGANGDREAERNGVPPPDAVPHSDTQRNGTLTSESDASTIAANSHGTYLDSSNKEAAVTPNPQSRAESLEHETSSIERREGEVHELARRFTRQSSIYSTAGQNPFRAEPGSALDPNGGHFNARAWCKTMLQMHTEDQQAHPLRTVGLSFKNLNVHGFGSDTDYQKSVGNVLLEGVGLARKLMGHRQRKIEILQSLDGLVEAGEMLVVLGPPGSGCSTFLKTISGETHGFFVDQSSHLNFQGALASIFFFFDAAC